MEIDIVGWKSLFWRTKLNTLVNYLLSWESTFLDLYFIKNWEQENQSVFITEPITKLLNSRLIPPHFFFSPVFIGIQCPSCEGDDENDCDSQIKMEVCPNIEEKPTCAVFTCDKAQFKRFCVNQPKYEKYLNKCQENSDCVIGKYGKPKCGS